MPAQGAEPWGRAQTRLSGLKTRGFDRPTAIAWVNHADVLPHCARRRRRLSTHHLRHIHTVRA